MPAKFYRPTADEVGVIMASIMYPTEESPAHKNSCEPWLIVQALLRAHAEVMA
jgi:hypothetical protein